MELLTHGLLKPLISYPKKNTPVILRPNLNTKEEVQKKLEKKGADINQAQTKEETPTRIGTAKLYVPKEEDAIVFDDAILAIANSLTDADRLKLITRKLEAGKYGYDQSVTIWATQIPQIRKAVEYNYGLSTGKFASNMANRICHQQRNFRFLTQFEKVCAVMYGTPNSLEISETIYNEVAKQVIKEQHLDFSDGRNWRGYVNMERMKKIYKTMKR